MPNHQRMLSAVAVAVLLGAFLPGIALAQGMGGMCENCEMGPGMWVGMLLGALVFVALIAALVALAVFLVRRSRPPRGPREA